MPPKKKNTKTDSDDKALKPSKLKIQNFYLKKEVQAFKAKTHCPNLKLHEIDVGSRVIILGSSGSGKTNILTYMLNYFTNTYNNIYIIAKSLNEPLYKYIKHKLKDNVEMFEGMDELNSWDLNTKFKDKGQSLIIFDDLVLEKNQEKIEQLYIRGRKLGGGCTIVYLTQSYYNTPSILRKNMTHLILRKVPNTQNLNMILKDISMGISKEELQALYTKCVSEDIIGFLTIHLTKTGKDIFKKNFNENIY